MSKPVIGPLDAAHFPLARDVAPRAGVSTSTVSPPFNGTARVRPDKHEAVMKAVQDLGFVANGAARALSMRRFMAVGAVVPNIENESFVRTLSSFQERMRPAGYTLLLTSAGYELDNELHEATFLLERGIYGLMLVGDIHRPKLLAQIARPRVPLIQTFSLSRERACIGFDNAAAAARAACYLMDLGHRRIGMITGPRKDNDRAGANHPGAGGAGATHACGARHRGVIRHRRRAGCDAADPRHWLGAAQRRNLRHGPARFRSDDRSPGARP